VAIFHISGKGDQHSDREEREKEKKKRRAALATPSFLGSSSSGPEEGGKKGGGEEVSMIGWVLNFTTRFDASLPLKK